MLSRITITCFAASYAVSLALEISRLFFRVPVRVPIMFGFAVAGLVAHTGFLTARAQMTISTHGIPPLSSWFDFCLIAAWLIVAAYLVVGVRRPNVAVGIFLLPLVLILICIATSLRETTPFRQETALWAWRLMHGFALMTGTAAVVLGFASGVMYLIQAYRLKHKLPPRPGFRLPSLEWLQQANRESLLVSTSLLAVGLVCGVILNAAGRTPAGPRVAWTDPVVLSSALLFAWLTAVVLFESFYRPARQGKKVAYLTVASFLFLGLAIFFVLFGEHAAK